MKEKYAIKEVLLKIIPKKEELTNINEHTNKLIKKLQEQIKKQKINAEIFIGGSFAKGTIIKKQKYDIDIFIRFNEKYKDDEISNLTEKIIKNLGNNFTKIHGSRDYFNIKTEPSIIFEVIPVIKIKNPKEARNVTDLSFFHINYVKKQAKNKKLEDEIRLAKSFCYAQGCYGAESYIHGFSGYALELLICYFGSFLKFIKEIAKNKGKDTIIDMEKNYKNKQEILMNLNASKIQSPIVLIDPTFKERNALAALSKETFEKFKNACKKFLKNPSEKFFEPQKVDLEKIKNIAKSKKYEFVLLEAETNKQEGDVAGSKLLKFYNFLGNEISKFFEIKDRNFIYDDKKTAKYYFVAKNKKQIFAQGPPIIMKGAVEIFKKKHKNVLIKNNKIYAREKTPSSIKEFIKNWKTKNKNQNQKIMKQMGIIGLNIK